MISSSSSCSIRAIIILALFNLAFALPQANNSATNEVKTGIENTITNKNILNSNLTWNEIQTFVFPNINQKWMSSIRTWYFPLMSGTAGKQLQNYFTGLDKEMESIDWDDFCGKEIFEDPFSIMKGFKESQIIKFYFDKPIPGVWGMTYWTDKLDKLQKATALVTLTDNANFLVEVRIWKDGSKDWIAFTTDKKKMLAKDEMDQILKHVGSIGFDPKDFIAVKYDHCS